MPSLHIVSMMFFSDLHVSIQTKFPIIDYLPRKKMLAKSQPFGRSTKNQLGQQPGNQEFRRAMDSPERWGLSEADRYPKVEG